MTAGQSDEAQEAFEKARFDYCWMVYESEIKRQQQIETKVQFYLSLVTLFLGVVFLNFGSIDRIGALFASAEMSVVAQYMIINMLLVLGVSLVTALVCILLAYRLLEGSAFYPRKFHDELFDPATTPPQDAQSFYYLSARRIAVAVEDRRRGNSERTKMLRWVQTATISAVFALAVIIGVLVFYTLP